jgi:hypothetical protein
MKIMIRMVVYGRFFFIVMHFLDNVISTTMSKVMHVITLSQEKVAYTRT